MLRIKPSIEVVDGKMIVGKKYRGNFDRCIVNYVKTVLKIMMTSIIQECLLLIPISSETVLKVREAIEQYASFEEIIETTPDVPFRLTADQTH
ncbi:hypothetical protein [Ureibacillus thermosphaericus]|uniref:hypothetical protein n=1 Tax=Ureibacillus thermosphaericus TaxID=51173 RepID=UPI0018D58BAE|nr:hypothetical protein [Ureibacillus thermosphaericus]